MIKSHPLGCNLGTKGHILAVTYTPRNYSEWLLRDPGGNHLNWGLRAWTEHAGLLWGGGNSYTVSSFDCGADQIQTNTSLLPGKQGTVIPEPSVKTGLLPCENPWNITPISSSAVVTKDHGEERPSFQNSEEAILASLGTHASDRVGSPCIFWPTGYTYML